MLLTNFVRALGEWRRYRVAVRELAALTDRDLSDIGLNRSTIRRSARFGADR
jgi:uncharacterized protein YjiS (DUF1127 family)